MTKFAIYSLIYIVLAVTVHAIPTGRIVGGADANEGEFPHQISLRRNGSHNCGGSIISRWYILTAAHCVGNSDANGNYYTYSPKEFEIRAGSTNRLSGGIVIGVESIKAHENYGNWLNDVALLKLKQPLIYSANIKSIPLAATEVPAKQPVIISGWGLLKHNGDLPSKLQWNTLTAISRTECKEQINMDSDSMLCLGHPANNGACNGDSGGPAIYNGEIVGVANFVVGGCGNVYADGYAKVFYQNDWIRKNSDFYATSVLEIRAGSVDRFSGGILIGIESIKAHENYGNFLNDMAVLKLKQPLIYSDNIRAAKLATNEVPIDQPVVISGWGRLKTGGDIPAKLQHNTLSAMSRAECKAQIGFDSDFLLCLSHPVNNGACSGDSGGPAMYNGEFVGVANFVVGGCGNIYADGYCKVFEQIDWIKANSDL